jgi:hypothetical protein
VQLVSHEEAHAGQKKDDKENCRSQCDSMSAHCIPHGDDHLLISQPNQYNNKNRRDYVAPFNLLPGSFIGHGEILLGDDSNEWREKDYFIEGRAGKT